MSPLNSFLIEFLFLSHFPLRSQDYLGNPRQRRQFTRTRRRYWRREIFRFKAQQQCERRIGRRSTNSDSRGVSRKSRADPVEQFAGMRAR